MIKYKKIFSGFSVDNLSDARDFYEKKLGIRLTDHPMGLLELHTGGNNPIIIYPKPNHEPATFTILNFPVDDIETSVDELSQKGVVFEQYTGVIQTDENGISRSKNGPNITWFKDPAGNILSIIEE